MAAQRVVVTGGAGFIGTAVTLALTGAGHDVVVVDDLSTGHRHNLTEVGHRRRGDRFGRVEFVEASILDDDALRRACAGASSVVHLAAQVSVPASVTDPVETCALNVTGTLTVLEAARREGAQVILASSAAVYGRSATAVQREDDRPAPVSPYAVSKLAAEQLLLAWQDCYGLPVLALRFFNVFGPRQLPSSGYAAVVPALVTRALRGERLRLDGDGGQTRDFVEVGTIARLITRAVTDRVASPTPVNVAFGRSTSLLDLVAALGDVVGHPLDVEHGPARDGDLRHSCGDPAALRRLFPGLRAGSLRTGLQATAAWHARRLGIPLQRRSSGTAPLLAPTTPEPAASGSVPRQRSKRRALRPSKP